MGAVVKLKPVKGKGASDASRGSGSVVAYPGINMREVEKMFKYIQRRDAEKARGR